MKPCQIADSGISLPCGDWESGGIRCERLDPHGPTEHWVSQHTIRHALAGNGYSCDAFIED